LGHGDSENVCWRKDTVLLQAMGLSETRGEDARWFDKVRVDAALEGGEFI
jgi:hypothetical protein